MINQPWVLAGLLALLLAGGAWALGWARRQSAVAGLPQGRVVYADMATWKRPAKPLFSPRYRLAGRPDYIVEQGRYRIPVEVKPTREADQPYASDIMQLAAYCLLMEEGGKRPPYGLLRYRSETFRIPYTPRLRAALCKTLDTLREQRGARVVRPNHGEPGRCLGCGYRHACPHPLA